MAGLEMVLLRWWWGGGERKRERELGGGERERERKDGSFSVVCEIFMLICMKKRHRSESTENVCGIHLL